MITLDVIVDLQYGDSGKGKVAHFLCTKNNYTHVVRYNGGANAGHTIFHNGKKFVTHQVPVGIFYGITSVIGSGCVVDPEGLKKELHMLEDAGIPTKNLLLVAENAHVVTKKHRDEDLADKKNGSTKRGIGPAYRDKYARAGTLARDTPSLKPYLVDMYEEFTGSKKNLTVLAEGAQGFGLDVDWGDYPFVTSSHCTTAGALLNGFAPQSLRRVWGIAKVYETRVGRTRTPFEPKQKIFEKIREYGEEYGATTGRPRQCNWLNLQLIEQAVKANGVTDIVLSKMDVLNSVGAWKVRDGKKVTTFENSTKMKSHITGFLSGMGIPRSRVHFSERKEGI